MIVCVSRTCSLVFVEIDPLIVLKETIAYYYSTRSYASAEYWIYLTGQFGGVHAFGYNSTESEPI